MSAPARLAALRGAGRDSARLDPKPATGGCYDAHQVEAVAIHAPVAGGDRRRIGNYIIYASNQSYYDHYLSRAAERDHIDLQSWTSSAVDGDRLSRKAMSDEYMSSVGFVDEDLTLAMMWALLSYPDPAEAIPEEDPVWDLDQSPADDQVIRVLEADIDEQQIARAVELVARCVVTEFSDCPLPSGYVNRR